MTIFLSETSEYYKSGSNSNLQLYWKAEAGLFHLNIRRLEHMKVDDEAV